MGVGTQPVFDIYENAGGGYTSMRRTNPNNSPDSPFFPTANDYGCFGWTLDPEDILTAAQTLTTGTLQGSLLVVPNNCTANRLSAAFATVQGAETNFNGVGLYSVDSGVTTLTKVAASANQTWTAASTTAITDAPFTAATPITPGYYWAVILGSTSGTAATIHGATAVSSGAVNFSKNSGVTAFRSFTFGSGLTALPATISLAGVTKSAFTPFLALS